MEKREEEEIENLLRSIEAETDPTRFEEGMNMVRLIQSAMDPTKFEEGTFMLLLEKHWPPLLGLIKGTSLDPSVDPSRVGDAMNFISYLYIRSKEERNKELRKIGYIRPRRMILMRGLPGSGKSYLAKGMAGNHGLIFSTMDWFINHHGEFEFFPGLLGKYEMKTISLVEEAAALLPPLIIVDNNNLQYSDMNPYVEIAKHHSYSVSTMIPHTPWAWNVEECSGRNIHNFTAITIREMKKRFER